MGLHIRVNEVGPRDGLQSQGKNLSVSDRLAMIKTLVEAGSFVSPKAVPQMAGTDQVFAALPFTKPVRYAALVPNMKGYELTAAAGANVANVVLSVTETMNQKNIRMSLDQTAEVCESIVRRGHQEGVEVQAYLAVAFECPFEGRVDPMGYGTGIRPLDLVPVVREIETLTGIQLGGKSFRWLAQQFDKQQRSSGHVG